MFQSFNTLKSPKCILEFWRIQNILRDICEFHCEFLNERNPGTLNYARKEPVFASFIAKSLLLAKEKYFPIVLARSRSNTFLWISAKFTVKLFQRQRRVVSLARKWHAKFKEPETKTPSFWKIRRNVSNNRNSIEIYDSFPEASFENSKRSLDFSRHSHIGNFRVARKGELWTWS